MQINYPLNDFQSKMRARVFTFLHIRETVKTEKEQEGKEKKGMATKEEKTLKRSSVYTRVKLNKLIKISQIRKRRKLRGWQVALEDSIG